MKYLLIISTIFIFLSCINNHTKDKEKIIIGKDTLNYNPNDTLIVSYITTERYFMVGFYSMEPSADNKYSYGTICFTLDSFPDIQYVKMKIKKSGADISGKRLSILSITEFKNESEYSKFNK